MYYYMGKPYPFRSEAECYRWIETVWRNKLGRWGTSRFTRWADAQKNRGINNDEAVWYIHRMAYKVYPRYLRMQLRNDPAYQFLSSVEFNPNVEQANEGSGL